MRTVLIGIGALIIGAIVGSAVTGYFVDRVHKRNYATVLAGNLGVAALQAELIKQGETNFVLDSLERTVPVMVKTVHENEFSKDSIAAEASLMATKRFYVCTGTAIPAEIGDVMHGVPLSENSCAADH